MATTVETTCRHCGRVFQPTAQDIRKGPWRVCPPCRGQSSTKTARSCAIECRLAHPYKQFGHPNKSATNYAC